MQMLRQTLSLVGWVLETTCHAQISFQSMNYVIPLVFEQIVAAGCFWCSIGAAVHSLSRVYAYIKRKTSAVETSH